MNGGWLRQNSLICNPNVKLSLIINILGGINLEGTDTC